MVGWYLLLAQLLGLMGFQISLPVGDFTSLWSTKHSKRESQMA